MLNRYFAIVISR